jgi:SecD/SecF fusion protein
VIFPQDSKFLWERPRDKNEPLYQLVAVWLPLGTRQAPLSGDIITDARLEYYDGGGSHPQISLTMNPVAAHVWANLTSNNVGRCIAIVFNGIIYSAPIVESQISGGRSSITGNFDPIEARQLVAILSAGYMPVPLKIVDEKREK